MKNIIIYSTVFFAMLFSLSSCYDEPTAIGSDSTKSNTLVPPSSYCQPLIDYVANNYPSSVTIDSVLQIFITPPGATQIEVYEVHLSNGVYVYFLVSNCSFFYIQCNCSNVSSPVCYNGQTFLNECLAFCSGAIASQITPGECQPCGCPSTINLVCYNGTTYNNSCLATCAGAQSWQIVPGACNTACITMAVQNIFLGSTYTIQSIVTDPLGNYTVVIDFSNNDIFTLHFDPNCGYVSSCGCSSSFAPVCDGNSNNYLNECEALCAGVPLSAITPGFCP